MPGRHTYLTPELQAAIVGHIRAGNYACVAAEAAGIGLTTYYKWLKRGESGSQSPTLKIYSDFATAIRKAEAEAEVEVADRIYKKLRGPDATIADEQKYLQFRYPERWGRNRTELTGEDGKELAIRVIVERPDEDE